jgi:hypothetical protein
MELSARHLIFHGAVMLLFGLLLGAPYARAIKRNAAAHIINSWRVAHASLPMGAILMLVTAALLPALAVSASIKWAITIALVISAYGFCIALPLAAITGQRGLAAGKGLGQVVYLGNVIGAMGSLVAAVIFLFAAFVSL